MHKEKPKDRFAAFSVSVDDPTDAEVKGRVVKFLESQKATFTNVILDEKPEVWQEKLGLEGVPAVMVFNAEGKVEKVFKEEPIYAEVKKLVDSLLRNK
jgi:hypothetical protein